MFVQRIFLTQFFLIGFFYFLLASPGYSQNKTLDRPYDPVRMEGRDFPEFNGAQIDQLELHTFENGAWKAIPFQIDERDTSGSLLIRDVVAGFDEDDLISFMVDDCGDKAPNSWLNSEGTQGNHRYEIAVQDGFGNITWAYLYKNTSGTSTHHNDNDYVRYIKGPGSTPWADSISGQTYLMGNGSNGLINYMKVFQDAGGSGQNIFDKQQVEITGTIVGKLNETRNFVADSVKHKDGNVCVIRELSIKITWLGLTVFSGLSFPTFYYGYSSVINFDFPIPQTLPFNATIKKVKQSLNLNEAAKGLKFFSKNNSDISVDGSPETISDSVTPFPPHTWLLFSGASSSEGTFVNLYKIPAIGDSQTLFYQDDESNGSIGNAGFMLDGNDIEGQASLGFTTVVPANFQSGQEIALGSSLASPLFEAVEVQNFENVTSVSGETDTILPESFALAKNFPNPFNPSTEIGYSIPLTAGKNHKTIITVYNLLGQPLRTLVNSHKPAGKYSVTWDGKDESGRSLSTGVYIYRLTSGNFVDSRKMLLLK